MNEHFQYETMHQILLLMIISCSHSTSIYCALAISQRKLGPSPVGCRTKQGGKSSKDTEVSRCIDCRENEQELFLQVLNPGHQCVTKLKHLEKMPIVRNGEFLTYEYHFASD